MAIRCDDPECKDAPYDGMHFTGGYDAQGARYYREFDEGCPWGYDRHRDERHNGHTCPEIDWPLCEAREIARSLGCRLWKNASYGHVCVLCRHPSSVHLMRGDWQRGEFVCNCGCIAGSGSSYLALARSDFQIWVTKFGEGVSHAV